MIRQGIVVVFVFACTSASANTMFRCIGSQGAVAYQDRPCDAKSRMLGSSEFTPEPTPRYRAPPSTATRPPRTSAAVERRGRMTRQGRSADSDPCATTKAARDRATDGKAVRFETLRYWNDRVYEACK